MKAAESKEVQQKTSGPNFTDRVNLHQIVDNSVNDQAMLMLKQYRERLAHSEEREDKYLEMMKEKDRELNSVKDRYITSLERKVDQ